MKKLLSIFFEQTQVSFATFISTPFFFSKKKIQKYKNSSRDFHIQVETTVKYTKGFSKLCKITFVLHVYVKHVKYPYVFSKITHNIFLATIFIKNLKTVRRDVLINKPIFL